MIEAVMVVIILERILTFKQIDRLAFIAAFAIGLLAFLSQPYSNVYPVILMLLWALFFLARAIRNLLGDRK